MIDVAVIGAGPGGLSAAVSALQRNKSVTIFGRSIDSGLLFSAKEVDNYLGMPNMTGEDMLNAFFSHAINKGAEFKECRVSQILSMGDYFMINAENEFFEAKTIILALGVNKSRTIKGEEELIGKGVSYCATCDGMLYRNKDVFVVGETTEGEAEANYLASIGCNVSYIPLYKDLIHIDDKVNIIRGKAKSVLGNEYVEGIVVNGEEKQCNAVFFAKKTMPVASLMFGLETENNSIKVDRNMCTNITGVYACGDCTGAPFQVSKAVGEGLVAALSAAKYIEDNQK
ncbi:NAD(P)/FAD-dependent oxidoreductase [Tyzzerella sp. An114]|uniref:NAD(P)/FAD-dependent oxidoreductase n=1 Tax=Tyzzerella sp. An114 TaxID=1965545 RepID=UPI0013027566|nr:FAD-dependent oxidoreductase [Tyzzerella sp. An114]